MNIAESNPPTQGMRILSRRMLRKILRFYGLHFPWHRGKGVLIGSLGSRLILKGDQEQVTLPCGVKMLLDLEELVEQSIYFWGYYERYLVSFMIKNMRPGMVVLDIGAHVGQYTLIAAKFVSPSGEVHAFEPCSRNFARLQENVKLNGFSNCYLNNVALGDSTQYAWLYKTDRINNWGGISICPKESQIRGVEICSVIKLDDYRPLTRKKVDLIKVDVEGAELLVLKGAERVISESRPLLVLEADENLLRRFGHSRSQIIEFIEPFGYRFLGMDPVRPRKTEDYMADMGALICLPL